MGREGAATNTHIRTQQYTTDTTRGEYTRTYAASPQQRMGWVGEWVGWMNGALQLLELLLLLRRRQRQEAIPLLKCSCEDKTWTVSRARVGAGLEGAGAPVQRHCPGPNPSHTQGQSQVPAADMSLGSGTMGDSVWRLHACALYVCPAPTRPGHGSVALRAKQARYMDTRACTHGYLPPCLSA